MRSAAAPFRPAHVLAAAPGPLLALHKVAALSAFPLLAAFSALFALSALSLLTGGCVAAPPAAAPPALAPRPPASPPPAGPSPTAEGDLAPGATHRTPVALRAGEALRARVVPEGADLALRLLSPAGDEVARADVWERAAEEELVAVAPADGAYLLEVAAAAGGAPGRYRLFLAPPRPAAPADHLRAAAGAAHERARALGQAPPAEAVAAWRETSRRAREAGARSLEADALWRLGMALRRGGEPAPAIEAYRSSLALWTAEGDVAGEADARNSLGLAQKSLGEMAAARAEIERALALFIRLGNTTGQAAALSNLATIDLATGEVRSARDALLRSLELARAANNRQAEARTLNNLGLAHNLLGDARRSLESYRRALELTRELGDRRGEATALHNVASAYDDLGDAQTARTHFQQALAIARGGGDRTGEAAILQNLGVLERREERLDDARRTLEEALALARDLGDRAKQARALISIGGVLHRQGDLPAAQAALEEAVPIARDLGDREAEAAVAQGLGSVARERGDAAAAVAYFERALALQRQLGARAREAEVLASLAEAHRRAANLPAALAAIEAAVAQVELLRGMLAGQALRSAFGASRQGVYETQVAILMDLHHREPEAGHDAAALAASESGKARALLDVLAAAGEEVREGADPALRERARQAREELAARELARRGLLRAGGQAAALLAAEARLDAAVAEHRRAEADLLASSPRYAALVRPEPLDLAGLRREVLADETALVEVALGEERSALWAVTREAIKSVELPARDEVETLARAVHAAVTERNHAPAGESAEARRRRLAAADAALERDAAALSRLLFSGVADLLAGRRLLVVPDGALHYVPFAALPDPGGGGPLLAHHEVVTLPSASVLAVLRREWVDRAPAPRRLAVFADPVFAGDDPRVAAARGTSAAPETALAAAVSAPRGDDSAGGEPLHLPRLRFSRQEAQAIAALVAPEETLLALDFAAARETVERGDLASYRLIHFATHGLLDGRRPELSSLVLSLVDEEGRPRDGYLRLSDIYNLRLNADLVVLSACRTALGREMRGEGLVGLTRGVMYAGSPRVVASLWSVDDRATAQLMRRFYEGMLSEGLPAAAALRRAQLELAAGARYRSPYYWAAFALQGEWR